MCLFRRAVRSQPLQGTNRKRPALLCPTSHKYAFSRYNRTSAHIIFVGGQQETAVHVFASTCTDRCPLLALSGQSIRVDQCPLSGVRADIVISLFYAAMSAYDPKRHAHN